jgi:hypothetical protein
VNANATGHTQSCPSCEEKLRIHERYVGRTLHCPHCGTEFLADPTLTDIDDLMEEMAPDQPKRFPLKALLVVVVIAALLAVVGQSSHSGFLAKVFKPTRSQGAFAVVSFDDGRPVPAAMDRETIVMVVDAVEDRDPGSLQALRFQGLTVDVSPGTRVKLIERVRRDRAARVRVVEGEWTGRVLWVPTAALR